MHRVSTETPKQGETVSRASTVFGFPFDVGRHPLFRVERSGCERSWAAFDHFRPSEAYRPIDSKD